MQIWQVSGIELFLKGGPIMWPILLCSGIAMTLIVERMLCFRAAATDVYKLKSAVFDLIKQDRIREALDHCACDPSPLGRILRAGILKLGCSQTDVKTAIDDVAAIEIPKLENHLPVLLSIAHTATLLGLLGTVVGMCGVFYTLEQRAASQDPILISDVAGGIWEALLTTTAGLLVSIPTFLAYSYLTGRVDRLKQEMEQAGAETGNLLAQLSQPQATE